MENPFSQAELDALMQELYQADEAVRHYDFKRPSKFGKDRVRALGMIHQNFARLLTGYFAAALRTRVQVTLRGIYQYTFGEFIQILPNPTVLCTIKLNPLPGLALMEVSHNVAYAIVERAFGGLGSDTHPQRGLSVIELQVMQRQITDMLSPLEEAWRNVAEIRPTVGAIETNPMFMQVMGPSEVLAALTLTIEIGEHIGHMTLALPFTTVEPVLTKLSPYSWFTATRQLDQEEQAALEGSVQQTPVPVTVTLGQTQVSLKEFLGLQVGYVIPLTSYADAELPVQVGNRISFYGRPGLSRGRAAVQITRSLLQKYE